MTTHNPVSAGSAATPHPDNSTEIESYKSIDQLRREADERFMHFATWCLMFVGIFLAFVILIFVWAFFTYL